MMPETKLNVFRKEFPWLDEAVGHCNLKEKRLRDARVLRVGEFFIESNGGFFAEVHFLDQEGELLGRYNLETTPIFRTKPFQWLNPFSWFAYSFKPISKDQQPSRWIKAKHVGAALSIGEWILSHGLEDVHYVVGFRSCRGGLGVTIYKPPKGISIIGLASVVRGVAQQDREAEIEALRREIAS